MTSQTIALQLSFNHHLGRNAGVISARLPQGIAPLHAVVTRQGIHDGVLEGVSHVQTAGDVGWWNDDAVPIADAAGLKITAAFP